MEHENSNFILAIFERIKFKLSVVKQSPEAVVNFVIMKRVDI